MQRALAVRGDMYSSTDVVCVLALGAVINLVIARWWRRVLRLLIVAARLGTSLTLAAVIVVFAKGFAKTAVASGDEL